jgi:hypothetical protein
MPLAELTNLTKHTFLFDPESIFAVNVQPGPAGSHTTFVWKVFNMEQAVAGTPADFLKANGLTVHFVQLTGSRGELWVRADTVSGLHAPFPGDQQPSNIKCMLMVNGFPFTAEDDVAVIRDKVNAILKLDNRVA